jgi:hypothetical protein
MNILDVQCLIDIERYRRIDVDAKDASMLYRDAGDLDVVRNAGFLRRCLAEIREVNFRRAEHGRIYLRVSRGVIDYVDCHRMRRRTSSTRSLPGTSFVKSATPRFIDADACVHTVGAWRGG